MNFFLKSRNDIDIATKYIQDNGLLESGLSCKNWDAVQIFPYLRDGNLLDVGSDGSIILENAVRKKIVGMKVGIDLAYPEDISSPPGINLMKGDLMNTGLPDELFNFITSCSVLEHDVDFNSFAKESSRLLQKDGQLFVSFDYAPEKFDTSLTKLYSLSWNVLSKNDVERFVEVCSKFGLKLSSEIDWTIQDMVINPTYCAPGNFYYTFGILHFIKQ